ncbi:sulfite exporter TauE/SafE family protein [Lysinibacillus xylanilyticus]|uniref:urease accessory protein UreH domain-containing protein n=1 Tax=Lysinibacillus xylanilyticus TaxID=582475 RepID=UPI002B247170|nr:sulfite exporter TauE/SafE family protein [Lysinibacillus xylanilyticus]MEB2282432.1 sulfite exporter TauE/SafE family protein [Lysinibacillus xylanilyticus]
MYTLMSKISQAISGPITVFLNSYEHSPFIIAILLGLIGALAPCQLTGNMSAITFYGSRTLQMKNNWQEIVFFILGKVVVFSLIGFFAWLFGQSFETEMTKYFPIFRKALGPIMLLTGLVLIGILKLKFLDQISMYIPSVLKDGKLGSFLMGASFSIAFCPTMFVLFFVWLMPTVATSSYGVILPAIFGIATSVPLLVMLGLIHLFDAKRFIMRTSMKMGRVIQIVAGVMLIIIGVADTITYWGLI